MSIYSNLFRYRPRQSRLPKEDFLSAALADVLNRLPFEKAAEFVSDVLLQSNFMRDQWLYLINSSPKASFRWETQVRIRHGHNGIIDLLLLVDDKETIVIESKVGAAVGSHGNVHDANNSDADPNSPIDVPVADANQLKTYGGWLAKRCQASAWPGALILLTHQTAPPTDFGGPDNRNYGVPIVQVCRWGTVWRWAKNNGANCQTDDPANSRPMWMELCLELSEFLEEENMTSEYMTLHDIAAVEVFISSATRIERTFSEVRKAINSIKSDFANCGLTTGNFRDITYSGDGGVVWSWFYVKFPHKKGPNDLFFGWGIRFPNISEWWLENKADLPTLPHVFLTISSDNSGLPISALLPDEIPTGWVSVSDEELVLAKPIYDFKHDAEGIAADFGQWVALAMKTATPMVLKLGAAFDQPS